MTDKVGSRTSRQITSLSNASLDLYPDNSLTHFTHRLPQKLDVKAGVTVQVALTHLIISGELDPEKYTTGSGSLPPPSYLKLHLSQLNPQAVPDNSESTVLARIPYARKTDASRAYRPIAPVFLPLVACAQVEELTFFVTDEANRRLYLAEGPPTVVQVEMETSGRRGAFSMSVNSEVSADLYPDNTLSEWRTEFPQSLNLDANWEVCLHSVQVPKALYISDSMGKVTLLRETGESASMTKMFTSPLTEMGFINFELNEWMMRHGLQIQVAVSGEIMVRRGMYFSAEDKAAAGVLPDDPSTYFRHVVFNPALCSMLGIPIEDDEGKRVTVVADPGDLLPVHLRQAKENYRDNNMIQGVHVDQLAVYVDLVEPSIMGNVIGPILDILPTEKSGLYDTEKDSFYALTNPIYRGVNPKSGKTMTVKLTRLDGESPPLMYDEDTEEKDRLPMTINLVFRKR